MIAQDILSAKRQALAAQLRKDIDQAPMHSKGFIFRLLGFEEVKRLAYDSIDFASLTGDVKYGGFPPLAYLGFCIGGNDFPHLEQSVIESFLAGLARLEERSGTSLQEFLADDIAVLGVADGIANLGNLKQSTIAHAKKWLIESLEKFPSKVVWSHRVRDLASDLLDDRGRLRASYDEHDHLKTALEISLRNSWPNAFCNSPYPDSKVRNDLLKSLLIEPPIQQGDIELTCIKLKALDLLVDYSIEALTPTVSDIVRLLERTQHSFKRWVWDQTTRRGQIDAVHWLIDNEAHMQAFLWAVLYPIFGQDLVDERYLPDFGQVQPRFDLGIIRLKLIIEVKVIRESSDFAAIEEQVGGDVGLYFRETDRYDRMVVHIYDDCDIQHAERYEALKTALKNRERIEDVVIVRRPSMMPNRNQRKSQI